MKPIMEGKVALITGGGTGLGAAVARRFHNAGAKIVVTGRRAGPIEKIAQEVGGIAVQGDVTDDAHLKNAVDTAVKKFGGLDMVVSNAGIGGGGGEVLDINDAQWEKIISINLTGVMKTARAAMPALIKRKGGSIVNIASVAGLMGIFSGTGYATTKSAILGLTRSLAMDYGKYNIRVNTLCPGWFLSEMSEGEMANISRGLGVNKDQALAIASKYLPLRRVAKADEIAACVEFLASDNASFVTGTILTADGGGLIVDVGVLGINDAFEAAQKKQGGK